MLFPHLPPKSLPILNNSGVELSHSSLELSLCPPWGSESVLDGFSFPFGTSLGLSARMSLQGTRKVISFFLISARAEEKLRCSKPDHAEAPGVTETGGCQLPSG